MKERGMKSLNIYNAWAGRKGSLEFLLLFMVFALLAGCAASAKMTSKQDVQTPLHHGPSVTRLEDRREGFVINEVPNMDSGSKSDFEHAVTLMNDSKNDKAVELLTKVVERKPGVTAPYINLALAYMRMGKLAEAEQSLKTALEIFPSHPVASNEYGLLLRRLGRFEESRVIYEKTVAKFPGYLPAHRNLGILCDLYLNDPECALKQFEIYSNGASTDAQVKIWVAELHMRLGK
jgi:Tfp pilus assembly protein PilF